MDEAMFKVFLKFVYSGQLDTSKMSVDETIEMLAVADRYEVVYVYIWSHADHVITTLPQTVSLKAHCEQLLIGRVEDSNTFMLLSIADRFSAKKLWVHEFVEVILSC